MRTPTFWLVLTHDVDRVKKAWWHSAYRFLKTRKFYHLRTLFNPSINPYWNFEKIMQLEEKYGVRSTFFFLNETKKLNPLNPSSYPLGLGKYKFEDPKIASIIKELDKGGWEIGLHGSYDSYLNKVLLRWEKEKLEKVLGKNILGCRQHYLNLKVPETWEIQREVGLKYDATFGYRRSVGWRENKIKPFKPFDDFLVIPLTIMDCALFGMSKNIGEIWRIVLNLIKIAERKNAVLTVLWHQRVFDENEFLGWSEIYEKIIKEGISRGAKITTCKGIWEEMG